EVSHMCIGAPVGEVFEFSLLRTHPPLEERMKRLLGPQAARLLKERSERAEAAANGSQGGEAFAAAPRAGAALPAAAPVGRIGSATPQHVHHARRVLDDIPAEVRAATGNEAGAKTAILALLLAADETRVKQLALIRDDSGAGAAEQCARFANALAPLG